MASAEGSKATGASSVPTANETADHRDVLRILGAKSHYEILGSGIDRNSSDDDVKKAYRTMALKTHPDKNKHERAEDAFKRVHSAFQALETKDKRDLYHRRGGTGLAAHDSQAHNHEEHFHYGGGDSTAFEFFNMFMRGGFGGRGGLRGGVGDGMDDIIMMMLVQNILNRTERGGGGGMFRHSHYGDDDEQDDYGLYGEDPYYEEDYYDPRDLYEGEDGYYYPAEYRGEEGGDEDEDDEDEEKGDGAKDNAKAKAKAEKDDDSDYENDEQQYEGYDDDDYDDYDDEDAGWQQFAREGISFSTSTQEFICSLCNVRLMQVTEMNDHMNGKRHAKTLAKLDRGLDGKSSGYRCELCDVTIQDELSMRSHMKGKKHQQNVDRKRREAAATQKVT